MSPPNPRQRAASAAGPMVIALEGPVDRSAAPDDLNGTIDIITRPGEGTIFRIWFPVADPAGREPVERRVPSSSAPASPLY